MKGRLKLEGEKKLLRLRYCDTQVEKGEVLSPENTVTAIYKTSLSTLFTPAKMLFLSCGRHRIIPSCLFFSFDFAFFFFLTEC
jgi:hypothetical protein